MAAAAAAANESPPFEAFTTLRSTSNALKCLAFIAQLWHWEEILKCFYVANCLTFYYLTGRSCP